MLPRVHRNGSHRAGYLLFDSSNTDDELAYTNHDTESALDGPISWPSRALFLGRRNRKANFDFFGGEIASSTNVGPENSSVLSPPPIRHELPPKRSTRLYRQLRWSLFTTYTRLFCVALLGNIAALMSLLVQHFHYGRPLSYAETNLVASANLLVAVATRNEHVVNFLFLLFASWSRILPLFIRHAFANVYSYGGIHSGCSIAAVGWYCAFLTLLTKEYFTADISTIRAYIALVSYAVIIFVSTIVVSAHPYIRITQHNVFEAIHRFMGWAVVLLFWAQIILLNVEAAATPQALALGGTLAADPSFWILLSITLLIIYPYLRLRRHAVRVERLSEHVAKLHFDYTNVHYGQAVRLTHSPLSQTHAFAVIPYATAPNERQAMNNTTRADKGDEQSAVRTELELPSAVTSSNKSTARGFSVLVSNAGDWTQDIIRKPPKQIWTRGVPQYGVLRVAGLFKPVIVVATGSGIGPCLSLFVQRPNHPVRIIWSAGAPARTYGQAVMDTVHRADPGARIIDTEIQGRPDLVSEIWDIWMENRLGPGKGLRQDQEHGFELSRSARLTRGTSQPCEAVIIISNQAVTRRVVYELKSRGVAAYGAIFDC